MKKILIFSGNSEADELVLRLAKSGIETVVSVAGESGAEALLEKVKGLDADAAFPKIKSGRMERDEIKSFISDNSFELVIDGTHPFAEEVSQNIKWATDETNVTLMKLERVGAAEETGSEVSYFKDFDECAEYLSMTDGNIFLATGAKEAEIFTDKIDLKRLYLRLLPAVESIEKAKRCGLENPHIIAMQGVFSKELNRSLFKEFDIKYLVTKESGRSGGFEEKLSAAGELGIRTCVIKRPEQDGLLSQDEIFSRIAGKKTEIKIVLAGVGMGDEQSLTIAVSKLIDTADALIATSSRIMPERRAEYKLIEYAPLKIAEKIEEIREAKRERGGRYTIAVLFSGDTGFYSGAASVAEELEKRGMAFKLLSGVSSLSMLSALSGISWQDAHILSAHGREAYIVSAVKEYEKTFLLLNDASELRRISEELLSAGLYFTKITAGIRLGTDKEKVLSFEVSEAGGIDEEGICCCFIENRGERNRRIITPGLKDEAFVRREVPMTKAEVRMISICRLKLKADSVLWDVGSGTGSISVEAARLSSGIKVYAFERNAAAAELTEENALKAGCGNIKLIRGEAPESFEGIEAPDAVFIGGSGGKIKEIIKSLLHFEKHIQIVLNCVTIDTIGEISALLKNCPHEDEEIVELQLARSVKTGEHRILKAQNPVFIVSFRI